MNGNTTCMYQVISVIGIIIYIVNLFLGGGDTSQLPQVIPEQQQEMNAEDKKEDDERAAFIKVVLGYTEDAWKDIFGNREKITKNQY